MAAKPFASSADLGVKEQTLEVLADGPFSYYRLDDRPWNPDGTPSRTVPMTSGPERCWA